MEHLLALPGLVLGGILTVCAVYFVQLAVVIIVVGVPYSCHRVFQLTKKSAWQGYSCMAVGFMLLGFCFPWI